MGTYLLNGVGEKSESKSYFEVGDVARDGIEDRLSGVATEDIADNLLRGTFRSVPAVPGADFVPGAAATVLAGARSTDSKRLDLLTDPSFCISALPERGKAGWGDVGPFTRRSLLVDAAERYEDGSSPYASRIMRAKL